jgi:uncharacterized protein YndB with AHSA1/START domain
MSRSVIEKKIEISAPPDKVWRVFTDPAITKQLGGEYLPIGKLEVHLDGKPQTERCIQREQFLN